MAKSSVHPLLHLLTFFLFQCESKPYSQDKNGTSTSYSLVLEHTESNYKPIGFGFEYQSCTECNLLEMSNYQENTSDRKYHISMADSLNICYQLTNNSCGFFEGHYKLRNDTVFVTSRGDAWEDCGQYCAFQLHYTIPLPIISPFYISIDDSIIGEFNTEGN